MRILVINTAASEGGALSVLKDFANNVQINDVTNEWYFLLSDHYIEETENVKIIVKPELKSNKSRLIFENYTGKDFIENDIKADIVFSMQNTTVKSLNIPQVLYLHQSLPFQKEKNFSIVKKEERNLAIKQHVLGRYIKKGLDKANLIIVQTQWMKKAVISLGAEASNIVVIPPTINVPKSGSSLPYQYNHFFYPTSEQMYKDIEVIERACEILVEKDRSFRVEITVNRKDKNNINYIGNISRERVFEKLQSSVLVFPSYIETFGLPLAEARKMNALILASDTVFSRELLYNYPNAHYFKVGDEKELASLMENSIENVYDIQDSNSLSDISSSSSWTHIRNQIYSMI